MERGGEGSPTKRKFADLDYPDWTKVDALPAMTSQERRVFFFQLDLDLLIGVVVVLGQGCR